MSPRFIVTFLVGATIGIAGTLGILIATDSPSFREQVREGLAEEWGDTYAQCMSSEGRFETAPTLLMDQPELRRYCEREANRVLP